MEPEEVRDWETHVFLSIIEFFFLIQFLMRFNTEFPHPETEVVIDDVKSITKYQVKSLWFENAIYLLPIIPFYAFVDADPNSLLMFKILRILRLNNELLPEVAILELARFFYTGESHNRDEKIDKDALVKNVIRIVKLVIITIAFSFFLACFWYRFNTYYLDESYSGPFMEAMGLEETDTK